MTVTATFPTIRCQGDAYQVGLTHGQQAKSKIANSVESYRVLFQQWAKLDWPAVMEIAAAFQKQLDLTYPIFMEELRGIAQGSGQDLSTIIALNCRSEIALTVPMDGCTSVAWSKEGQQFLSQNWDWSVRLVQTETRDFG